MSGPPSAGSYAYGAAALVLGVLSLILLLLGVATASERLSFVALGVMSLLAIYAPIAAASRRFAYFDAINLLALNVFLGVTARSAYLAYSSSPRVNFLTDSVPMAEMLPCAILVPCTLATLSLVYAVSRGRFEIEKSSLLTNRRLSMPRLRLVGAASILIAIVAAGAYLQIAHVSLGNLWAISTEHKIYVDNGGSEDSLTSLRFLLVFGALPHMAGYVLLSALLDRNEKTAKADWWLFFLLSATGALLPFIASVRTQIIVYFANCTILLVLRYGMAWRRLLLFVITAPLVVATMGNLRRSAQGIDSNFSILDYVIGSGNFFGIDRNAIIFSRVPEYLGYLSGQTYFTWITAPIPRIFWPEKPSVGVDLIVKQSIYGYPTVVRGFPPGLLGEAMMNFGLIGVFLCAALVGWGLAVFDATFRRAAARSVFFYAIYACLLWRVAFESIGGSFSRDVIIIAFEILPLIIVMRLSSVSALRPAARHSRHMSGFGHVQYPPTARKRAAMAAVE